MTMITTPRHLSPQIHRSVVLALLLLPPAMALAQVEKPFLWRVEQPEPSFLFGTVHLNDTRIMNLPAAVIKAQNRADVTVLEIDPDADVADDLWELPDHQRLSHYLSPTEMARIVQILDSTYPNIQIEDIDSLKPWVLEDILVSISDGWDPGQELDPVLDDHLHELAQIAEKDLRYLETWEEQIEAVDSLPFDYQLDSLMWVVEWLETQGSFPASEELVHLYMSGDEVAFETYLNETDSVFLEHLLFGRNEVMSVRMNQMIQAEPHRSFFFAVGVGHYVGTQSINDHLAAMGYRLTRIEQNDWIWVTHPMLVANWRRSDWFGFFAVDEGADWTFHRDLGWIRIAGTDSEQFHFFLPSIGWFWTKADIFPAAFLLDEERWIHLQSEAGTVSAAGFPNDNPNP